MKLEFVNPRPVYEACETALSDLSRFNEQERKDLFDRFRYRTVTDFWGNNPRQIKRTDEEIENHCDIEIAVMEHLQDLRKGTITTLYSAARVAQDIGAKMSLTTEEFLSIRNYFQ